MVHVAALKRICMAPKKEPKPTRKSRSVRATASLSPDVYATLQNIAYQKKVSVAWVIREASEKYIADQWPLLSKDRQ